MDVKKWQEATNSCDLGVAIKLTDIIEKLDSDNQFLIDRLVLYSKHRAELVKKLGVVNTKITQDSLKNGI